MKNKIHDHEKKDESHKFYFSLSIFYYISANQNDLNKVLSTKS